MKLYLNLTDKRIPLATSNTGRSKITVNGIRDYSFPFTKLNSEEDTYNDISSEKKVMMKKEPKELAVIKNHQVTIIWVTIATFESAKLMTYYEAVTTLYQDPATSNNCMKTKSQKQGHTLFIKGH